MQLSPALSTMSILSSDSNSISSVTLRWLPRSRLAVRVYCFRRALVAALFHFRNGIGMILNMDF